MSPLLIAAIVLMTLALAFYSTGVWAERCSGLLRPWHAIVFWCGFVCDSSGTAVMEHIAGGGFSVSLHAVTGVVALLLMAFHAVWATVILIRRNDHARQVFHHFSIVVWAIWLVPYVIGMVIGMAG